MAENIKSAGVVESARAKHRRKERREAAWEGKPTEAEETEAAPSCRHNHHTQGEAQSFLSHKLYFQRPEWT